MLIREREELPPVDGELIDMLLYRSQRRAGTLRNTGVAEIPAETLIGSA